MIPLAVRPPNDARRSEPRTGKRSSRQARLSPGQRRPMQGRRGKPARELHPGRLHDAVRDPGAVGAAGDRGQVVARRLPDVLHILLNAGQNGPAGMLEVQSPPSDGPRSLDHAVRRALPARGLHDARLRRRPARPRGRQHPRGGESGVAVDLSVHFHAGGPLPGQATPRTRRSRG